MSSPTITCGDSVFPIQNSSHQLDPPINRIPTEIWGEIFVLYIESGPTECMFSQISNKSGPYALVQTCSSWRSIALDLPAIWNEIVIELSNFPVRGRVRSTDISVDAALQAFNSRVAYSKNLPLDLHLKALLPEDSELSKALFSAVLSILPKCSSLGGAPSFGWGWLYLADILRDPSSPFGSKPYTQLTKARLNLLHNCDLPMLLQSCPNLRELDYTSGLSDNEETPWQNPTPFVHEKLECLRIRDIDERYEHRRVLGLVLRNVSLPCLKEFDIGHPLSDDPTNPEYLPVDSELAESLGVFLQNPHHRDLRVVVLDNFYLCNGFLDLMEKFSFTPGLEKLKIKFSSPYPASHELYQRFISLFTTTKSLEGVATPFLPNLQHLRVKDADRDNKPEWPNLHFSTEAQCHVEDFIGMAKLREDVTPLKQFVFYWDCNCCGSWGKLEYSRDDLNGEGKIEVSEGEEESDDDEEMDE
jgi:hypothetical protein